MAACSNVYLQDLTVHRPREKTGLGKTKPPRSRSIQCDARKFDRTIDLGRRLMRICEARFTASGSWGLRG